MNAKGQSISWTAKDRARHKAIRNLYEHHPTQEELESSGDYEGPIKGGAYFLVRVLVTDLKRARILTGQTLADVAKQTGIDQATLSRLENGRQTNPTVDTLWRYARALNRDLVLTHAPAKGPKSRNGRVSRPVRKTPTRR
jgi:DNA-binding XRE family transcriptional regulator